MLIEKRIVLLNSEGQLYLMLDGKVIDQVKGSPREVISALERGEYDLPPESSIKDVQYISLKENISSPEEWYNNQEFPSCGCHGQCGKCCGK